MIVACSVVNLSVDGVVVLLLVSLRTCLVVNTSEVRLSIRQYLSLSLFSHRLFAVRALPPLIITLCCIDDKTMVRNNTAYKLLHSVKTDTVLNGVKNCRCCVTCEMQL